MNGGAAVGVTVGSVVAVPETEAGTVVIVVAGAGVPIGTAETESVVTRSEYTLSTIDRGALTVSLFNRYPKLPSAFG